MYRLVQIHRGRQLKNIHTGCIQNYKIIYALNATVVSLLFTNKKTAICHNICRFIIEFREQYLWPKTDLGSFYPRDALHSAVFEFQSQVRCPSVCPSVRLSVIHRYCV